MDFSHHAGYATLKVTYDELLPLRHGLSEALEALNNADDFRIRTGRPRHEAEALLDQLIEASRTSHFKER